MKIFSVLHCVIKVTSHYLMLHRFEIHSAVELLHSALLGCRLAACVFQGCSLAIDRLSFTFTSNGKRALVPLTKFPLYLPFTVHYFYPKISSFSHKYCFELFLSAHFLFREILNLNLTFSFTVYVKINLSNSNLKIPEDKNLS